MPTQDPNRMHDIRTVKRHIRAGRTSPDALSTFLSALPDAEANIRPAEEGGDADGFDEQGKEETPAVDEVAQPDVQPDILTAAVVPSAPSTPQAPKPLGNAFSADFDPAAHLADDPMMPPPQPIPGFGALGGVPAPSAPTPSAPTPSAPIPSAPLPSAPTPAPSAPAVAPVPAPSSDSE